MRLFGDTSGSWGRIYSLAESVKGIYSAACSYIREMILSLSCDLLSCLDFLRRLDVRSTKVSYPVDCTRDIQRRFVLTGEVRIVKRAYGSHLLRPHMNYGSQPSVNIFFQPDNLDALPALWLQVKLTISSTSIQDKFVKLFICMPHTGFGRYCQS